MAQNTQNINIVQQKSARDIIREEYTRCALDPVYFLRKYCYIQHPTRGKVLFNLYPFQEDILRCYINHKYNVVLKSRQLGLTTVTGGYALWKMLFTSDFQILVISKDKEAAKELVSRIRLMFDDLPSWLKVDCIENNKLSLIFKNGSSIKAFAASAEAGRSLALSLLILDEAAFIDQIDTIWTAAAPAVTSHGSACTILSTPNGVGNFFHKTWVKAEEGKEVAGTNMRFYPTKLKWNVHPDRDQTWRDAQVEILGSELRAAQECFDGETRIYTKFGLVPIKNIKIGDEVLTHTGEFKPVIRLYEKDSNDIYEISSGLNQIKRNVTGNHPFFTPNNKNIWTELNNIKNKELLPSFPLNCKFTNNNYKLNLYDIIKPKHFKKKEFKNKFYINDRKHKKQYPKTIDIDYDLGYIVGLYLAEGSKTHLATTYSFNYKTELELWPKKIIEIIKNKFNIEYFKIRNQKNSGQLQINSEVFSSFIDYFIDGNKCYNKKLSKNSYNTNIDYLKGVLDGIFDGDGCKTGSANIGINITSLDLQYDIKYILNILGINKNSLKYGKFSGISEMFNRVTNIKQQYSLNILQTKYIKNIKISNLQFINNIDVRDCYKNKYNIIDNYIYSNINKEKIDKNIKVYNIEVKDNNSYVTEHFIVHNCDCDFLTSGHTVINADTIKYYREIHQEDAIEFRYNHTLHIWQPPNYTKDYIVCADVARGDGSDYSTFHVLDVMTMEQVAEFKGQISTIEFANLLVSIATEYNKALLVIENANIGWSTVLHVVDVLKYDNVYYSLKDSTLIDVESQIMKNYDMIRKEDMVPGFTTSMKIRPMIISKLETYMRDKQVIIHSKRTLDEIDTFIWLNYKPQAMLGYNDDLIMALAIGLWVRDTALALRQRGIDLTKASVNAMKQVTQQYQMGYNSARQLQYNPFQMTAGFETEDISWLLTSKEKNNSKTETDDVRAKYDAWREAYKKNMENNNG